MLGLFRLRYYFGLRPTSLARVQVQPLETQSCDWVLSFKSKEIFPFQGMRASCPQARMTRHPHHSATYIEPQPLVLDFVVSDIVRSLCLLRSFLCQIKILFLFCQRPFSKSKKHLKVSTYLICLLC